jgi:predicted enzyme related to lactoylglutathione lyase
MPPTFGNGKICYIEIPTTDVQQSADFYAAVFGWTIRTRTDGSRSFDDGVGEVSGTWRVDRPVRREAPGILTHIMVDDIQATIARVKANGGVIVQDVGADDPEITAWFTDPSGNQFGLYQHRG